MENTKRDLTKRKNLWIHRVQFLPSEEVVFLDKTTNGGICVTNFRMILYCRHQSKVISVPVMLIRSCEVSSLVYMTITTKIGTTFTQVSYFKLYVLKVAI